MKVLLHICCGVCAAGAAKQLMDEGHEVTGYFFNPNIYPAEEYEARLEATKTIAHELDFKLEAGLYEPDKWLASAASLADEKEGGRRCELCFRIRLQAASEFMKNNGFDAFTTTLTIGPRKSAEKVNSIGTDTGGSNFLVRDFKKKDGFKKANDLAKKLGIYRQNYCGCIYSLRSG